MQRWQWGVFSVCFGSSNRADPPRDQIRKVLHKGDEFLIPVLGINNQMSYGKVDGHTIIRQQKHEAFTHLSQWLRAAHHTKIIWVVCMCVFVGRDKEDKGLERQDIKMRYSGNVGRKDQRSREKYNGIYSIKSLKIMKSC